MKKDQVYNNNFMRISFKEFFSTKKINISPNIKDRGWC